MPPAASTPSLVRLGGWLYAAYRSTTGDLVVLRQGGGNHLHGWVATDVTVQHHLARVLDDPRCTIAGSGTGQRLSIAWVSRAHRVEETTALRGSPTRLSTLDLSRAAALGAAATGDVAEVQNRGRTPSS